MENTDQLSVNINNKMFILDGSSIGTQQRHLILIWRIKKTCPKGDNV